MPGNERAGRQSRGSGKKLLSGEEFIWHEIASRTGRTVREAKHSLTATDFLKWAAYLNEKDERTYRRKTPEHYYFAGLRAEVAALRLSVERTLGASEKRPKPADYLIEFEIKGKQPIARRGRQQAVKPPSVEEVKQAREDYLANSKAYWLAIAGMGTGAKSEKKNPPPKPGTGG